MDGPYTVVASAARTATGNSGVLPFRVPLGSTLSFQVSTTAVSGTSPSMTLSVQWSNDGVNFAAADGSPDSFTAITAAGNVIKSVTAKGLYAQLVWTITGTTPSFTFSAQVAS